MVDDLWDGSTEAKDERDFSGFGWDAEKAEANLQKHGVSFEEATEVFAGSFRYEASPRGAEMRYVAYGRDSQGRALIVVYTFRASAIWLISARFDR